MSARSVLWALTTGYYNYWHPLTWMSHMLDCECFGLDARIPHLENALLQAADAVLLFALLTVLTGKWERSLLVAAIFAVHPIHVESVAWMAERKDVLSMFFFLLTLGAYARYAQNKKTLNPQLPAGAGLFRVGPDGQTHGGEPAVGAPAAGLLAAQTSDGC